MPKNAPLLPGTLYIVATPIGNLEDMTFRAVRILKEVDLIAAEDTRHTRKLLKHYDIQTKLISYYREKEQERAAELITQLQEGKNIALVSDAGTPGISDPGAILVNLAWQANITVCPIPGSSAQAAAISVAGLDGGTFLFLGFPPAKPGQRRTFLKKLRLSEHPVILYESPRRIRSLLSDAIEEFGDRQAFWGREITKAHEELHKKSLKELLSVASDQVNRGETVLIIFPEKKQQAKGENINELLIWYRDHSELSLKDVSKRLASDLGLSRSEVYRQALVIWQDETTCAGDLTPKMD
jgi:16S rRNA (cytidine1402-2'-O)-methyltransferase